MTTRLTFMFLVLLVGQSTLLAQRAARLFKIFYEEEGKRVKTKLRLRLKHKGEIIEINYTPGKPVQFPKLEPREEFDLWIISDNYTLPFLKIPGVALSAAGWRVGIDDRPFDLKGYIELTLMPSNVRCVYYKDDLHPDGGETRTWIHSYEPAAAYRNPPVPANKRSQSQTRKNGSGSN